MESKDNFSIELGKVADSTLPVLPVSVHCSPACNLVVWSSPNDKNDDMNWVKVRFFIAQKMDQLADLLRDLQWFSPLVAIIDTKEKLDKDLKKEWEQLAGDQDWHRGRFIVQIANIKEFPTVDDLKRSWLGPLQVTPYTPKKIDNNRFKELLLEAIPTAKIPTGVDSQLFSRYTDNVLQALEENKEEQMTEQWQQEIASDLNNLLGKSFFEGINNDAY